MKRVFKKDLPPFIKAYRKNAQHYEMHAHYITPAGMRKAEWWYIVFFVGALYLVVSNNGMDSAPGVVASIFVILVSFIPAAALANSSFIQRKASKEVRLTFTDKGLFWGGGLFTRRRHIPANVQWRPRAVEDPETTAKMRRDKNDNISLQVIIESGSHWQRRDVIFEIVGVDSMAVCEQTVTAINFIAAQVGNAGTPRPASGRRPREA